jgi:hypothetical protein
MPPPAVPEAAPEPATPSNAARRAAPTATKPLPAPDDPHTLWQQAQAGIAPLKKKR